MSSTNNRAALEAKELILSLLTDKFVNAEDITIGEAEKKADDMLSTLLRQAEREARVSEADKAYANAKHLLERAHKWQLTETGRTDMITGELLLPAEDRVKQLKGEL